MTTYTGPVPIPPGPQADAATWANWWAYQNMLLQMRWEDERAARYVITDEATRQSIAAQNARAAAEEKVALAGQAAADAQRAVAAALNSPEQIAMETARNAALAAIGDGLKALAAAIPPAPVPSPFPTPAPAPEPAPTPFPGDLIADTVALAHRWQAKYVAA